MATIIFDLVGTLLTHEKNDYNAALKWLADNYFEKKYDELMNFSVLFKSMYLAERKWSYIESSFFKQMCFFEESMQMKVSDDYKDIEAQFIKICRNERLMDGAIELLDVLYNCNYSILVLTNSLFSGDSLKEYLGLLGIERYIIKIYSSADIGFRKPSKNVFDFVLKDAGIENPNAVYYVGDSYEKDYVGANKCGLVPILLSKKHIISIKSFENLYDFLDYLVVHRSPI